MGENGTSGGDSAVWVGRFAELEGALCERVRELRAGDPLRPVTVVVGSAAVRTRIGDLLVRRLGAVANVRVVTLSRHAADLVARAQGAPPVALTGIARERLLRRLVAARARTGLAYFGPVWERPHFPQALLATFDDLREGMVDPASGWAAAVATAGTDAAATAGTGAVAGPGTAAGAAAAGDAGHISGAALSGKADDLRALYVAYCAELDRIGALDDAELYRRAAAAARDGTAADRLHGAPQTGATPCGPAAATILYGVYDLNQAQEAFVMALLASRAGAVLLVPAPRDDAGEAAEALAVARRSGLAPRRLQPPGTARDVDRLAALWRASPPAPGLRLDLEGDGTLTVASVADERAESREAVRVVLAALSAGAAAWDCAVVVPRADDFERLAAALGDAGLPVACHGPDKSLGPRVLRRLVDCLAPPAGGPFARRAVLDLLSAAPLRVPATAAEVMGLWADEARQAGVIGGPEQWTDRIGRRRRGLERRVQELEARGESPAEDDEEAGERLGLARRRLAAARTLEVAAAALARAGGDLPSRASWSTWAGLLGDVAAVFDGAVADAVADAAGRLNALALLDEEVDAAEMAAVVREQLAAAAAPQGRVGRDGVAVLTPLQLRGLRFHTVVFTGLAEGGFPARGRPDPILGDAERRRIAEASGVRLPLAEARDAESRMLFAFAAEAARERLVLLSPRTDAATGRPRLPSRLLLRLASLAVGHTVGLDAFLSGEPLAPVWRRVSGSPTHADEVIWVDERERDVGALLSLSAGGRRTAASAYLAAVLGDEASVTRRLGAWRASRSPQPGPWDGLLGDAARAALAEHHPFDREMHPTRLERYIDCPFAFLLRDVLGLDAPEEPDDALEITPLELGTLAHAILQLAYERVIAGQLDLAGTLEALGAAWDTCCSEAESRGVTGAALSWEVRRQTLLEDLLESVRLDPVYASGDGHPAGVEWRFGEAAGRPVLLEGLPGGRVVAFAGRLDRVDVTPAGARVIDYKTGAGGTEKGRIKDGLSVQLPVYQSAVRTFGDAFGLAQAGEDQGAAITALYRLVTRRGGFADLPLGSGEAAAGARLRELVSDAITLVDAGMFPRSARGRCDYCDVKYACGVSAWARARKREHGALAPVVRLQKPAKGGGDGA